MRQAPHLFYFEFNQPVGGTIGAVRVYDAAGHEVDTLTIVHPDGKQSWIGVGLKSGLPDGTYVATYRVISADTHIVYGGAEFNIGHASASSVSVTGLIARDSAGEPTLLTFGALRALDYVTIALAVGGLCFLLMCWLPVLAQGAEAGTWRDASRALARRSERVLAVVVVVGIAVSLLGILVQGADAAGIPFWRALKGPVLESTIESRFGVVWGGRVLVWVLLGLLLFAPRLRGRRGVPALEGDGTDLGLAQPSRIRVALLGVCALALVLTPALSGHASVQGPVWAFLPADIAHVGGAAVWVGASLSWRSCCRRRPGASSRPTVPELSRRHLRASRRSRSAA